MNKVFTLIIVFFAHNSFSQCNTWIENFGDDYGDVVNEIILSGDSSIYLTGKFVDSLHLGNSVLYSNSSKQFIAKFDLSGNVLWAFDLAINDPLGLAIDSQNNLLVSGEFSGLVDFDPSPSGNTSLSASSMASDAFLAKYTDQGSFLWAFQIGTTNGNSDRITSVTVDENNNIYISGRYYGTVDMDPSPNTASFTSSIGWNSFIGKYTEDGQYVWAYDIECSASNNPQLINYNDGTLNILGTFAETVDFDLGPGVSQYTSNSSGVGALGDNYLVRYDTLGQLISVTQFEGNALSILTELLITNNSIFIAGQLRGEMDLDPSSANLILASDQTNGPGFADAVIIRLDLNGNLIWGKSFGGAYGDGVTDIEIIGDSLYVGGIFNGTVNFSSQGNQHTYSSLSSSDAFIANYNLNGNINDVFTIQNYGSQFDVHFEHLDSKLYVSGSYDNDLFYDPCTPTDSVAIGNLQPNINYDFYLSEYDLNLSPSLSVDQFVENPLKIFPNPFQNEFIIEFQNNFEILNVTNIMGQNIEFEANMHGTKRVISILGPAGTYFLAIETDQGIEMYKVYKN